MAEMFDPQRLFRGSCEMFFPNGIFSCSRFRDPSIGRLPVYGIMTAKRNAVTAVRRKCGAMDRASVPFLL